MTFKHIAAFLSTGQNRFSRWLGYFGLCTGVLLLLCSAQLYVNIDHLLKNKNPKKDGFDYISVTKTISNENMLSEHAFSYAELDDLKKQSSVDDAAPFLSNKFVVRASGGSTLPFASDIFLESLDNQFLDTVPPTFKWSEGETTVPVILGSDYLELYNTVFAPSRDLPQFSEKSISSLLITLECEGNGKLQNFKANIVAMSDRINTVIVPKKFLEWANQQFSGSAQSAINKILVKTKDANDPELLKYIQQNDYHVNRDKTRFGRIKQILQAIVSGLAGFAILVIILAMVLFSFYLQLMIARSKDNLQLLLLLGYSPRWLANTVSKKWTPVYVTIVLVALVGTAIMHWAFTNYVMKGNESLSVLIDWKVIVVAVLLLMLSIFINNRLVKKLVNKL